MESRVADNGSLKGKWDNPTITGITWPLYGYADLRLHDARRTCLTNIARLTGDVLLPDRIANHGLPGVVSRYNLHDFKDEKAEGLKVWSDYLEELVGGGQRIVLEC